MCKCENVKMCKCEDYTPWRHEGADHSSHLHTFTLWQVVVYIHCGGPYLVDDLEAAGAAHLGVHAYGYHVLICGVTFVVDGGGVLPEGLVVGEVVGRREFPGSVIPPSF